MSSHYPPYNNDRDAHRDRSRPRAPSYTGLPPHHHHHDADDHAPKARRHNHGHGHHPPHPPHPPHPHNPHDPHNPHNPHRHHHHHRPDHDDPSSSASTAGSPGDYATPTPFASSPATSFGRPPSSSTSSISSSSYAGSAEGESLDSREVDLVELLTARLAGAFDPLQLDRSLAMQAQTYAAELPSGPPVLLGGADVCVSV